MLLLVLVHLLLLLRAPTELHHHRSTTSDEADGATATSFNGYAMTEGLQVHNALMAVAASVQNRNGGSGGGGGGGDGTGDSAMATVESTCEAALDLNLGEVVREAPYLFDAVVMEVLRANEILLKAMFCLLEAYGRCVP